MDPTADQSESNAYPAGGDSTGPAANNADEEAATPQSEDGSEAETPDDELPAGPPKKNHLYLPGNFPFDKKPEKGDPPQKFLVEGQYIGMSTDGEFCFEVEKVDGVDIESDESPDEEAAEGDEGNEDETEGEGEGSGEGDDQSQLPEDASDMEGEKPEGTHGLALLIAGKAPKKKK
jgi:hypothetical protein